MNVLGLSPGVVLGLVREARAGEQWPEPLLVVGPLAAHLARSLAEGGEAGLVRTEGSAASASAVVCILGGAPKPAQVELLRAATRAGVPCVAVQTGDADVQVPYVLPADVVACRPGEGFPVGEIAAALVRGLGREAAGLAARLPVLRPAARRELELRAAGTAACVAAFARDDVQLPVLVPLQARMLRDLDRTAGGPPPETQQEVGIALGQQLGAALVAGLGARTLVRRLPFRNRVVEAVVAGAVAAGLAEAARRLVPSA